MENYSLLFRQLNEFMLQFISGLIAIVPFFRLWLISKPIFNKIIACSKVSSKNSALVYFGKSAAAI